MHMTYYPRPYWIRYHTQLHQGRTYIYIYVKFPDDGRKTIINQFIAMLTLYDRALLLYSGLCPYLSTIKLSSSRMDFGNICQWFDWPIYCCIRIHGIQYVYGRRFHFWNDTFCSLPSMRSNKVRHRPLLIESGYFRSNEHDMIRVRFLCGRIFPITFLQYRELFARRP